MITIYVLHPSHDHKCPITEASLSVHTYGEGREARITEQEGPDMTRARAWIRLDPAWIGQLRLS